MDNSGQKSSLLSWMGARYRNFRESCIKDCEPAVSWDKLNKEIRILQPTQFFNSGLRADFQIPLSKNFMTVHSFMWGSDAPSSSYSLTSIYAGNKCLLHGQLDSFGMFNFQGDYYWSTVSANPLQNQSPGTEKNTQQLRGMTQPAATTTRVRAQVMPKTSPSMIHFEHEIFGKDYTLLFKAINPTLQASKAKDMAYGPLAFQLQSLYSAAYLQKVSRSLSLGAEYTLQHLPNGSLGSFVSYALRYTSYSKDPLPVPKSMPPGVPSFFPPGEKNEPRRTFSLLICPAMVTLYSAFTQRVSQRLEVFTEFNISTASFENAPSLNTITTAGFKLDTVNSTIRTMLDSNFTVTTTIEERLFPTFGMLLSTKMDYSKGFPSNGQVGLGFTLEA